MTTAMAPVEVRQDPRPRRRNRRWLRESIAAAPFIVPSLFLFAVFVFYPFIWSIWLGFHATDPFGRHAVWVGTAQYGERPAAAAFEATVEVVEMLGNETHATLLLDAASMIARLPADEGLTPGTKARFVVAPEHLHFFDGATGRRLE